MWSTARPVKPLARAACGQVGLPERIEGYDCPSEQITQAKPFRVRREGVS